MQAAITPRTCAFVLCSPHNPVGRCFTRAELQQLITFCSVNKLLLVSDELHCDLVLDKKKQHVSVLSLLPRGIHIEIESAFARDNSITIMAPNKTFNTAGFALHF
jgi:cystathionine beta-lyase